MRAFRWRLFNVTVNQTITNTKFDATIFSQFYGYTDLEFIKEPRKLLKQAISAKEIATIDQTKPVWDDPFLAICCIITVFSKRYCRTFTDYQKMGTGLLTHCQTKH